MPPAQLSGATVRGCSRGRGGGGGGRGAGASEAARRAGTGRARGGCERPRQRMTGASRSCGLAFSRPWYETAHGCNNPGPLWSQINQLTIAPGPAAGAAARVGRDDAAPAHRRGAVGRRRERPRRAGVERRLRGAGRGRPPERAAHAALACANPAGPGRPGLIFERVRLAVSAAGRRQ